MSLRSRVLTVALALFGSALLLPATASAAELDGTWDFVFANSEGSYPRTLVLSQEGEAVSAKYLDQEHYTGTFKDGVLELTGQHTAPEAGYAAKLTLTGKLEDGRLAGKATWDYYDLSFEATRKPSEPEAE
jgi:hypothetical protein